MRMQAESQCLWRVQSTVASVDDGVGHESIVLLTNVVIMSLLCTQVTSAHCSVRCTAPMLVLSFDPFQEIDGDDNNGGLVSVDVEEEEDKKDNQEKEKEVTISSLRVVSRNRTINTPFPCRLSSPPQWIEIYPSSVIEETRRTISEDGDLHCRRTGSGEGVVEKLVPVVEKAG